MLAFRGKRAFFIGPKTSRGGRGDRNTTFLLLLHPIHGRRAIMHLTDLMRLTGIIEHAFGRRRFTRIDMRHDADIACLLEWILTCHGLSRDYFPTFPFATKNFFSSNKISAF